MSIEARLQSIAGYSTTGLSLASSVGSMFAAGAASTAAGTAAAAGAAGAAGGGGAAGAAGLAALGSASTIIGLAATPVIMLLGKIFSGADPRQVPAAQIEQTFESAAISLLNVAKAGMISGAEAVAGMNLFLEKGVAFFESAPELRDKKGAFIKAGSNGVANMRRIVGEQIAKARQLGDRSVPWDLNAARALYVSRNRMGLKWYEVSLQAGDKLAESYLLEINTPVAVATSWLRRPWVVAALLGSAALLYFLRGRL